MISHPLPHHQTIAIAGVGAAGSAAARLLAPFAERLIAVDARTDFPALPTGVECRPASHDVRPATAIVISPGFNPEWPANRHNPDLGPWWEAVQSGAVELVSEVELAARALPIPWITVGGTDGKSTTAALAAHLLRHILPGSVLGGNSWTAISDVIRQNPDAPAAVVEVSAFQLQAGHRLRPKVAILTNIAPDHLDHYVDFEAYCQAKHHIWAQMGEGDTLIIHGGNEWLVSRIHEMRQRGIRVLTFDNAPVLGHSLDAWVENDREMVLRSSEGEWRLPVGAMPLPGPHNLRNALAALLAMDALVPGCLKLAGAGQLRDWMSTFSGLPHRIEFVRQRRGVTWFNDSKATNVHAALTGLRAMKHPFIAIVGGVDKQLDLQPFFEELRLAAHVLVIGELTNRFLSESAGQLSAVTPAADLADAVARASELAPQGGSVILAPACSSFDMFRSFEHRGDVFRELVLALPD
jgi:UDP-N-acetylmuramoylalanine--D-glutamate ligase